MTLYQSLTQIMNILINLIKPHEKNEHLILIFNKIHKLNSQ